jgi:protease-4
MRLLRFIGKSIVVLCAIVGALLILAVLGIALTLHNLPKIAAGAPPQRMVLTLDLADGLVETLPTNPFALASMGRAITVNDALKALTLAAADERVKVLLLRLGTGSLDLARAQELADAVTTFRRSGKPVIAFAEDFGEGGDANSHYVLATAANQILVQPSGGVQLTGAALQTPFFRGIFDKLGIQARLDHREEYKGAANSFLDDSMPAPQRTNMQALVESLTEQITDAVAKGRHIDPVRARDIVEHGPYDAAAAQSAKLIDGTRYWDQVQTDALALAGAGAKTYALTKYIANMPEPPKTAPRIALVYGIGNIILGDGNTSPLAEDSVIASRRMSQALHKAVDDPKIVGIILRIDSGGGSYLASDAIWREVARARELHKPLVVSMAGVAASGGYFLAAPAAVIVAEPATITGSIGVFSGKFVIKDLLAKLGITVDSVSVGANSLAESATADYTPAQWALLEANLDRIYADFLAKVADGRGLSKEAVRAAAKGQIWSGSTAKVEGLVDLLGGIRTATDEVRRLAKIDLATEVDVEQYPSRGDQLQAMFARIMGTEGDTAAALRPLVRILQAAASLTAAYDAMTGPAPDESLRAAIP